MDSAGLDRMESQGALLGKHQEELIARKQTRADVTTQVQRLQTPTAHAHAPEPYESHGYQPLPLIEKTREPVGHSSLNSH